MRELRPLLEGLAIAEVITSESKRSFLRSSSPMRSRQSPRKNIQEHPWPGGSSVVACEANFLNRKELPSATNRPFTTQTHQHRHGLR